MTKFRRGCVSTALSVLVLSQSVFGQNTLDLKEADARQAAYKFISVAEERFDCGIKEHSMLVIGDEPKILYVFRLSVEGDECEDALIFLASMAARDDQLLFRQISADYEIADPLILDSQVLIHEVNPEIEESEEEENHEL